MITAHARNGEEQSKRNGILSPENSDFVTVLALDASVFNVYFSRMDLYLRMSFTVSKNDNFNTPSVIQCLKEFSQEYYELHPSSISIVEEVPSSIEFIRNWLSLNTPVIIKNAVSHWPALTKWNIEYLRSKLQNQKVTVAVTPNGYADAVFDGKFLLPEEKEMTFNFFIDSLLQQNSSVYYIQKQNNNLIEEFPSLHGDFDLHIPWASEAIGRKPDAVNFWMGDERAVTSLHKDHYENIYCVIKGKKDFILHPPIDAPWIPYETYDVGIYSNVDEEYQVKNLDQKVKWISIDPLKPDYEKYPLYKNAHMIHCTVEEGDALYLPSLWFHHVRQSHACIAVNYWYDMDFNAKYCYFKLLEKMGHLLHDTFNN